MMPFSLLLVITAFKIELYLISYFFSTLWMELYPNQLDFGKRIIDALANRRNVLAFAHTQCGKTGSMLAAFQYDNTPNHKAFVITGLSSTDWLAQTKSRIPIARIFHRNTLHHFIKIIQTIRNPLVFIDECHIAFKPGQAIWELLPIISHARVVFVSATPDMKFFKPDGVRPGFAIRVMKDPPGYVSLKYLSDSGHILQCKNISDSPDAISNIQEIIPYLSSPAYHIIRTPKDLLHQITIHNFRKVFLHADFISLPTELSFLAVQPLRHTFVFIKDTLRCAITIPKPFIGVLYERFSKYPNKSSIIQGLAGRATGFGSAHILVFSFPGLLNTA